MECEPTVSDVVVKDAPPPLSVEVPSRVEPLKNCTFPVPEDGVIAAVNVTGWPLLEGLSLDVRAVEVFTLRTSLSTGE